MTTDLSRKQARIKTKRHGRKTGATENRSVHICQVPARSGNPASMRVRPLSKESTLTPTPLEIAMTPKCGTYLDTRVLRFQHSHWLVTLKNSQPQRPARKGQAKHELESAAIPDATTNDTVDWDCDLSNQNRDTDVHPPRGEGAGIASHGNLQNPRWNAPLGICMMSPHTTRIKSAFGFLLRAIQKETKNELQRSIPSSAEAGKHSGPRTVINKTLANTNSATHVQAADQKVELANKTPLRIDAKSIMGGHCEIISDGYTSKLVEDVLNKLEEGRTRPCRQEFPDEAGILLSKDDETRVADSQSYSLRNPPNLWTRTSVGECVPLKQSSEGESFAQLETRGVEFRVSLLPQNCGKRNVHKRTKTLTNKAALSPDSTLNSKRLWSVPRRNKARLSDAPPTNNSSHFEGLNPKSELQKGNFTLISRVPEPGLRLINP
ncbi:hypothetical protein C8R47DRAFT_1085245 [Mycena vitilis]|nr:hypothetical protein C8R47DRAFT_1085245 [Mycena vitilis]